MKNENTSVQKIANYLRHEITFGCIKSGKHIKEIEVARLFQMSRVPVREALRVLQSEGYVDIILNRGCFVRKISADYIVEICSVYSRLVPIVLEKAIPKYTETTFKKADIVLNKIENCTDFSEIGYLTWNFAKVIYGPSKMGYLLSIFDEIYRHNIRILNDFYRNEKHTIFKIQTHRKFLELCRAKRNEEAIKLWIKFIGQMKTLLEANAKKQ